MLLTQPQGRGTSSCWTTSPYEGKSCESGFSCESSFWPPGWCATQPGGVQLPLPSARITQSVTFSFPLIEGEVKRGPHPPSEPVLPTLSCFYWGNLEVELWLRHSPRTSSYGNSTTISLRSFWRPWCPHQLRDEAAEGQNWCWHPTSWEVTHLLFSLPYLSLHHPCFSGPLRIWLHKLFVLLDESCGGLKTSPKNPPASHSILKHTPPSFSVKINPDLPFVEEGSMSWMRVLCTIAVYHAAVNIPWNIGFPWCLVLCKISASS